MTLATFEIKERQMTGAECSKETVANNAMQMAFQKFVTNLHQAPNLDACWSALTDAMAGHGFDRMMYGRKPHGDIENFNNFFDAIYFSSMGEDFDRGYFENRGYVNSVQAKWAALHTGAASFRMSADLYKAGKMSKPEAELYEVNLTHDAAHGMTYTATPVGWQYLSGFGLVYKKGFDHNHVEAVWKRNEAEIESYLKMFDVAVAHYVHVPSYYELTENQCRVLRLAAEGKTIADISTITGWHRRTVDGHMAAARERLMTSNTLQAVMKASLQGQI